MGLVFPRLALFHLELFRVPFAQVNPAIVNPPVPPYTNSAVYTFARHLQLPYTLQWNTSMEQELGKSQALTISCRCTWTETLSRTKSM